MRHLFLIAFTPFAFAACAVDSIDDADGTNESMLAASKAKAPATAAHVVKLISALQQAATTIREQAGRPMGDG